MVMGVEKFHDLLSASRRPRKFGSAVQSESEGLRTRGTDSINPSLRDGEGEMRYPSSHIVAGQREKFFLFSPFFYSSPQ